MNVQDLIARLQQLDPLMPVVLIGENAAVLMALEGDAQVIPTPGWHVSRALLIAPAERWRSLVNPVLC